MNTYPLVSIVLATYNGERYLPQQLDAIISQTYTNIEIIAVDDKSTDNTLDILQAYSLKHTNLKIFVNETNLGFIKNFDKGCGLSAGEFIALCDQDDYWAKDKIEKLLKAIEHFPLIYSDSFMCDAALKKTGRKLSNVVNYFTLTNCLQQAIFCRLYGNTLLFTRSLYNKAHPFITVIPHDWWLAFNATLCDGIKYFNEPLVFYRQHEANLYGAIGRKKDKRNKAIQSNKIAEEEYKIRTRVDTFYNICPAEMAIEKKILQELTESYKNFSLINNCKRVALFLKYRHFFLSVKKQSAFKKILFCCKMFIKIK